MAGQKRFVELDPSFPNTYVPDDEFRAIANKLATNNYKGDAKFEWNFDDNYIRYKDTCEAAIKNLQGYADI